ncbi:hypothetical protein INR99_05630 [Chitinilyticum litopenaei]|uniref:Uncharacterized protein n=2 Tax=Chitinilyticum piscinae TaxID=2866724 RepID=A0A8J7K1L2_9NEIS|nr:hypothetical protein [Chitinilyticum piscinae]
MDTLPYVAVNELDASQLMCWTEMANALQQAFAGLHPVLAGRRANLALELQGLNNQGKLLRTYGG